MLDLFVAVYIYGSKKISIICNMALFACKKSGFVSEIIFLSKLHSTVIYQSAKKKCWIQLQLGLLCMNKKKGYC